jgi:hypothetical protein
MLNEKAERTQAENSKTENSSYNEPVGKGGISLNPSSQAKSNGDESSVKANNVANDRGLIKLTCSLDGPDALLDPTLTAEDSVADYEYLYSLLSIFMTDVASILGGVIPKEGTERQLSLNGDADIRIEEAGGGLAKISMEGSLAVNFNKELIYSKVRKSGQDSLPGVEASLKNLARKLGRNDIPMTRIVIKVTKEDGQSIKEDQVVHVAPPKAVSYTHQELMFQAFASRSAKNS